MQQSGCSLRARSEKAATWFSTYAFSYELGVTKPDPSIYRAVCQGLGIAPGRLFEDAAQIAKIGDSSRCNRGIKGFHLERSGSGPIRNLVQFAKLVIEQNGMQR